MVSDYDFQLQQAQKHSKRDTEALRLRAEQAKADAEATKKLESVSIHCSFLNINLVFRISET
jgi:hypothetical protein